MPATMKLASILLTASILSLTQAGTPVTLGAHCNSGGTGPNDVQCLSFAPKAYICIGYDTNPAATNCKAPSNSGPAICLHNNVDNKCAAWTAPADSTRKCNWWGTCKTTTHFYGFQHMCWEGHEMSTSLACPKCKIGRYRGNTAGNHRVDVQDSYCSACVPGTFANQEGLKVCDQCQSGMYSTGACDKNDDDGGPAGGCIACKTCLKGQYQNQAAATACIKCDAGRFTDLRAGKSAAVCGICADGSFVKTKGARACDLCPAGYYSTGPSATDHDDCTSCLAGQYAASDGATGCIDCEIGKHSSAPSAKSCSFCSAGQETDKKGVVGGSSCIDCTGGHFENAHLCTVCPIGWNQINTKQSSCVECVVGKHAPAEQTAVACTVCHNGEYQSLPGKGSCTDCGIGTYSASDNVAHTSCLECVAGKHQNNVKKNACLDCLAGKYQDQRQQKDCVLCLVGLYSDQNSKDECKDCGDTSNTGASNNDPTLSYQDEVGKQNCKLCSTLGADYVVSSTKTGCNTCFTSTPIGGIDSFLGPSNACAYCQGCDLGSFKDTCDATATCKTCTTGRYKDTSQVDSNSPTNKGSGWDTICSVCDACDKGTFRDSNDACRFSGATDNGKDRCQTCSSQTYKTAAGKWDDVCDPCESCSVGHTRTGCGGFDDGICTSWSIPTVISVSGSGQDGGRTEGTEVLEITGKFFGPVRSGDAAKDVIVRYGSASNPPRTYVAKNCEVINADVGLAAGNVVGNNGLIRCETIEGVGKDHKLTVQIGITAPKESVAYDALISYQAPIVATYQGPGSSNAYTYGGQTIVVRGANFGPLGTVVEKAVYGEAGVYEIDATDCSVTSSHTEITCKTGKGAGQGHKMVLTIGGQLSTIPTINYGAPMFRSNSICADDPLDHGKENGGILQCSCAKCPFVTDWTLAITAQDITQSVGVAVTQGSATGTLKTALNGVGMTSIVITTTSVVTFESGVEVVIGATSSGTFTGDAFAAYDFATNADETLTVIVDGSDVAIVLGADFTDVASAAGGITIAGASIVVDGNFLKITSTSTGTSSSITIKADSGTHAQALFGTGVSVTGGTADTIWFQNVITATNSKQIPTITIGDTPCWHSAFKTDCLLPTPSINDIQELSRLSTRGNQLILLSGINFGGRGGVVVDGKTSVTELESVSYGPTTGNEISMPIYQGTGTAKELIPKDTFGCAIHVADFSILCNTKPGIAGPHKWNVVVKGQTSGDSITTTITRYSPPSILSRTPSVFKTDGTTEVVVSGTEFGTFDTHASFQIVFSKGVLRNNCDSTIDDVIAPGDCFLLDAYRKIESNNEERIRFIAPEGYGSNWKLRMFVTNSVTGQSSSADAPFVSSYGIPLIETVAITGGSGSGSLFQLTISGKNFCNEPVSNCGILKRCNTNNPVTVDGSAAVGGGAAASSGTLAGTSFTAHDFSIVNKNLIVSVDGVSQTISIVANCDTAANCATALTAQITGASVSVGYERIQRFVGNLVITSATTGSSSTITIESQDSSSYALALFGFQSNAVDCLANQEHSYDELDIVSWTHTQIVANVGSANGIIYLKIGNIIGSQSQNIISNLRMYSTDAMTIKADGNSDFIVYNGDIVYKNYNTVSIPTSGSTTRLSIWVEKLEATSNIKVEVGEGSYDCQSSDVVALDNNIWSINFLVPAGMGLKNTVYVSKDGLKTQNAAYISYGKPIITTITLQTTGDSLTGTPGVISTEGDTIEIVGSNFGDPATISVGDYSLRFRSTLMSIDSLLMSRSGNVIVSSLCTTHTHSKIVCSLPPGSGIGYVFVMTIGGQSPEAGFYPPQGTSINYKPPVVTSITPNHGPTESPGTIVVAGQNFGVSKPSISVTIEDKACEVVTIPNGAYHNLFSCIVADGEGANLDVKVVVGKQPATSTVKYSYDKPVINSFSPGTGLTSGKDISGERQSITILGNNFGTLENENIRIVFETTKEVPQRQFVADGSDIILRTHNKIVFKQPRGFGAAVRVRVDVLEQKSDYASNLFVYETPSMTKLSPSCGTERDGNATQCYGFSYPGFPRVQDYPKIISIEAIASGTCKTTLSFVAGKQFSMEKGDLIRISGMEKSAGQITNQPFNFNGEWTVTSVPDSTSFHFACNEFSLKGVGIIPTTDTYAGWNFPKGNLRALASKKYQSSKSASFLSLETDGCATEDNGGRRKTQWESFGSFEDRLINFNVNDAQSQTSTARKCDLKQRLVLSGTGFGSKNIKVWNSAKKMEEFVETPINVTMAQKICDCEVAVNGDAMPCRHKTTLSCAARASDGLCPSSFYEDCSVSNKYETPRQLTVLSHNDNEIVVESLPGYGRRHKIQLRIGTSQIATAQESAQFIRYLPPSITAYETNATVFTPDGKTSISFMGNNLGYGTTQEIADLIEVRIGVEYDIDGTYCGDQDKCMKICSNAVWHASKKAKSGGTTEGLGFPYIDCIIPEDIAGFKNVSIRVAGQQDDCSTNRKLCGYPTNFPTDRRVRELGPNLDLSSLIGKTETGLIFTCATSSMAKQSFARPGELCSSDINGDCEDDDCTKPKSHEGFWRLDLDLEFACTGSKNTPCQEDITGKLSSSQSVMEALNPWADNSVDAYCSLGSQIGSNETECKSDQRLCSDRGKNIPGACLFRRPLEARRALGKDFWPWACPGAELPWDNYDTDPAKNICRNKNSQAYDFVQDLEVAGCPRKRINHLINFTTFETYPGIALSSTCYSVVACNPKESCLGDNQCAEGYDYQKLRCENYNAKNPQQNNCTSDDQCRSRSNSTTQGDIGLASACSAEHPEDCARCVFDKSASVGTCECIGGGPRCGLCRHALSKEDSIDGIAVKGYFRLNDACLECPDDPALLLGLMAAAMVVFCIGGWFMQDKKINVAFLSIGVDYFQVLAIFARLRIRWPAWMSRILEVLSIFNFNIDIAAPECLIREFDYKTKWIIVMSLPLIFAGILLLIFISLVIVKCVRKSFGCSGKATRFFSHANKLISMFIIIFYFIYLSVTRRALDIFNCKPVDPPDGYLYTEFTSIECEGGICRCDDPNELQAQLKAPAIIGLLVYSIGFPIFVGILTWYYRIQMKADQLLRAYDLGDDRSAALDGMRFTPRACRSTSRKTYDIRKKYHKLYYHFKPGKVYWMLVILARKFLIALFALLFRANIAFMLACVILILFASYVLQVRSKPYMSTVERVAVKEAHRFKANAAQEQREIMEGAGLQIEVPADLQLHADLHEAILSLRDGVSRRKKKRSSMIIKNLGDAVTRIEEKKGTTISNYYFDYNTVEQVLLMCAIFLCLVAIMFESGQFYETDAITGISLLRTDDTTAAFYQTVVIIGGLVLIGSLVYYFIVFLAEVVGHVPKWVRVLFASRKTRAEMHTEKTHMDLHRNDSFGEHEFEMAEISVFTSALESGEKDKLALRREKLARERAEQKHAKADSQNREMMSQLRKLKQEKNRGQTINREKNRGNHRTTKARKEMAQVRVNQQKVQVNVINSMTNPMMKGKDLKSAAKRIIKSSRRQVAKKEKSRVVKGNDIGNTAIPLRTKGDDIGLLK